MTDLPSIKTDKAKSTRWRSVRIWLLLGAAVIAVGLVAGAPAKGGPPLDPRSTAGNGTKALVLLLQQFHATVGLTTGLPGSDINAAVVLTDQLTDDRRAGLERWVAAGGTVVVADPTSSLQPAETVDGSSRRQIDGPCPQIGLADVHRLDTGGSLLLRPPPDALACFPGTDGVFLVDRPAGRGRVIGLGGAGVFTNGLLDHDDNSVLAVDLLAGSPGTRIAVLLPSLIGTGQRSLASLISAPVKLALIQLIVAFALLVLWRSRRLGRPIVESQPVQVAGSELVIAVGNLLARSQSRDAAATALRGGLRRWLAERLSLGPAATIEQIADAGSVRTGMDRDRLGRALTERPLGADVELVELAQSLERIRDEVVHGRP